MIFVVVCPADDFQCGPHVRLIDVRGGSGRVEFYFLNYTLINDSSWARRRARWSARRRSHWSVDARRSAVLDTIDCTPTRSPTWRRNQPNLRECLIAVTR